MADGCCSPIGGYTCFRTRCCRKLQLQPVAPCRPHDGRAFNGDTRLSRLWLLHKATWTELWVFSTGKRLPVCFYRASSYANAVLGLAVELLSVRLSVTRVLCDKTKRRTADISILHERAIALVFWHKQWLVRDTPNRQKFALKMTHPLLKTPTSTDLRS